MGKTSRWLRALLGAKKSSSDDSAPSSEFSQAKKEKKKWGFIRSFNANNDRINNNSGSRARGSSSYPEAASNNYAEAVDANKHAIAVAAATAAVAEAALAAAHAAAEVVRLTSGGGRSRAAAYGGGSDRWREGAAAVKIQSAFRAYLLIYPKDPIYSLKGGLPHLLPISLMNLITHSLPARCLDKRKKSRFIDEIHRNYVTWSRIRVLRSMQARRALRALKGLVRLQALVRGHIVRKQSADMLRRMQAMVRIQARACANRAHPSEPSHSCSKSSKSHHLGLATPKKYDKPFRAFSTKSDRSPGLKRSESKSKIKNTVDPERNRLGSNWLDQWMEGCSWNNQRDTSLKTGHADDERSDKILEVDTWKPHLNSKQHDQIFSTPQHVTAWNSNDPCVTTSKSLSRKSQKQNPRVSSLTSLKFATEEDRAAMWTSENSPQVCSASSRPGSSGRRGPFTPSRSECSRSFLSDYLGHPNYMANTESSLSRVRSQSAPKQRTHVENFGSTKSFVRGFWDGDTISERGEFRTKAGNSGPGGSR
ncbi:unnamed protein product [Camellia sinensis]